MIPAQSKFSWIGRTLHILRALRFLFYPLPLLIIAIIICLTHILHANGVRTIIIVAVDAIPIAVPVVWFYVFVTIVTRRARKQFRDEHPGLL